MTATSKRSSIEIPNQDPRPAGRWRIASFLAAAGAVIVGVLAIIQANAGLNTSAGGADDVSVNQVPAEASDLGSPEQLRFTNLSLTSDDRELSQDSVQVISGRPNLIQLTDINGTARGLRFIADGTDVRRVVVSADSTARALLSLTPALLGPSLGTTVQNVAVVGDDPAYAELVNAIAAQPDLTGANESVEIAFAALLDRIPPIPQVEAGPCDQGEAMVGLCVTYEGAQPTLQNQLDRWVVLFTDEASATACIAIAPISESPPPTTLDTEACPLPALLAAPGPTLPVDGADTPTVESRVELASLMNQTDRWIRPLADLVGGRTVDNDAFVAEISAAPSTLLGPLSVVASSTRAIDETADAVGGGDVTRQARHKASLRLARLLLGDAAGRAALDLDEAGAAQVSELLDFFDRAGSRMTGTDTSRRWTIMGATMLEGDQS